MRARLSFVVALFSSSLASAQPAAPDDPSAKTVSPAEGQSSERPGAARAVGGAGEIRSPNAPQPEDEPELDALTFHRANYFITGFTRDTQVKFQFSIKYDLWPSKGHHTVYFAYTQRSLWDLFSRSSPFRESNYAPELFYAHYHSEVHGEPGPGCGLFSEQAGIAHESNGEASDSSRSWNRLFVDVAAACNSKHVYGLVELRVWYPLGVSDNESITQTQGYGELGLAVGFDDVAAHTNGLVSLALRKGANFDPAKGSVTLDVRWRPTYQRLFGESWKLAPYVWFQLFTGYGETLGSYDRAQTSLRVGIGFTDRSR